MSHRVRALILAGSSIVAFAAWAPGASAAGEQFHCSVVFCFGTVKPDETAGTKTAHHVFIVKKVVGGVEKSGSFTCNQLTGEIEQLGEVAKEVTIRNVSYDGCTIAGSSTTVDMNGCDYLLESEGGGVAVVCPAGASIQLTVGSPVACTVTVPSQELEGLKYHNVGEQAKNTAEVTAQAVLKKAQGTAGAGCVAFVGFEGEFTEAEYSTGNSLVTVENLKGIMANAWWA